MVCFGTDVGLRGPIGQRIANRVHVETKPLANLKAGDSPGPGLGDKPRCRQRQLAARKSVDVC